MKKLLFALLILVGVSAQAQVTVNVNGTGAVKPVALTGNKYGVETFDDVSN